MKQHKDADLILSTFEPFVFNQISETKVNSEGLIEFHLKDNENEEQRIQLPPFIRQISNFNDHTRIYFEDGRYVFIISKAIRDRITDYLIVYPFKPTFLRK